MMDDPELSKYMTSRERYYAKSHREKLSFSQWINYFFFIGSAITPMHEYRDLEEFINYEGKIKKMPRFGNVLPAFRRFIETWACIGILVLLSAKIKPDYMLTPDFANKSIMYRVSYLIASMHVQIYKLYSAFGSIEVMFIATGFSYTPKRDKIPEEYNSIRQVKMIDFELQLTVMTGIVSWNICTANWLKYYT